MITETDKKFLRTAQQIAHIWSKDPSTKVGAVAVGAEKNQVAFGYNGFPPGIEDDTVRLNDRPTKYRLTIHAEENALINAAFPVHTIYVTHCPCDACALRIVATRSVKRVVYLINPEFQERWRLAFEGAHKILREAGVEIEGVWA